jgi:chromosome segregation ATPase
MGGTGVNSLLPEDIEERLSAVRENISLLERELITAQSDVEAKKTEFKEWSDKAEAARLDYEKRLAVSEGLSVQLNDREAKISQKESALGVYANALKEKEDKVNKYLNIFENMKNVISK